MRRIERNKERGGGKKRGWNVENSKKKIKNEKKGTGQLEKEERRRRK